MTASSWAAPSPIRSPTTTTPVAMPIRAARASRDGVAMRPIASRILSAARTLSLVLMGPRPAKIGHYVIAHELRHMAIELDQLAGRGALVGAHHLAHLLGVEAPRQRS